MLNLFFWCLLAANGLLFAFSQGLLEPLIASGHEPARIGKQLNPGKLTLLPADAPGTTDTVRGRLACTEIGNFTIAEAGRFEAELAPLGLDGRLTRREIAQASSYMVFIPPQDGKAGADRRVAQLRQLDLSDFFVIQDISDQRWGISLGIFKTEAAAGEHLATLSRQGIQGLRVVEYQGALRKIAFQLRELDAITKDRIDKIKEAFPEQETRACE
jgi:hypothetical protein